MSIYICSFANRVSCVFYGANCYVCIYGVSEQRSFLSVSCTLIWDDPGHVYIDFRLSAVTVGCTKQADLITILSVLR